jgi:hypothetical protein
MTTERWNYLWGLVVTVSFAAYQFRAAEMNEDRESATRERTTGWVAVLLAILALYLLVLDPAPRYPR